MNKNTGMTSSSNTFTPENLKKKFRVSEYLAEKLITGVAFLSITVIILIFIFVFREAFPLFSVSKAKTPVQTSQVDQTGTSDEPSLKPETYGADDQGSDGGLKPETYGSDSENASVEGLRPETYGLETDQPAEEGLRPEAYVPGEESLSPTETPVMEKVAAVQPAYNEEVIRQTENKQALSTLLNKEWQPVSDRPRYGLWPLFLGTLKVTLIAMLFAAPIGILAALFTSSFASGRIREILKPALELLSGFPSVVIGFFALMVLASFFQDLFHYDSRLNAFVGGVAMALAAIPIVYTITEDALTAVPATYKEASLALGASKWQTALFVTLPAATPGIFASLLLGTGRVFGETMIALMATGNASMTSINPFDSVRTLSATIGAEMAEVVYGDTHYSVLFLIGALLFLFTFILNSIAEFYVKGRLMRRIMGR